MVEFIDSFIRLNFQMLYFPHGLLFFSAGIGILVQHRKKYPFPFAKDLWIMGIFLLIHAVSEWQDLFVPIQPTVFDAQTLFLFTLIPYLVEASSYTVLFIFGLRLLYPGRSIKPIFIPLGIFLFWCVIVGVMFIDGIEPHVILNYAQKLFYYLLLVPGSLVTAWALYRQGKKLPPKMLSSIHALAVVFVFIAIFNGLAVNLGLFLPGDIIYTEVFHNSMRLPIQFIRGLLGTALVIVTLKLLMEFNKETDRILVKAEEDAMRFSERERIGQDLHDGVIQTLYATGLMLESSARHLDSESPIREQLNFCIKSLNSSLLDLRHYITGLKGENISRQSLKKLLEDLLSEVQESYFIGVEYSFLGDHHLQLSPNRQNHLYYCIKELINNIEKHTKASKIHLKLVEDPSYLRIELFDNGDKNSNKEFWKKQSSSQNTGMGLRNIRERILILRGDIDYSHPSAGGTLVTLQIPKEVSIK